MKNKMNDIEILSEDKIVLTQNQINLVELAFIGQVPPEDVEFIKKVQKETKGGKEKLSPFAELGGYYTAKYGIDFGMLYLAAVMGGEDQYKEVVAEHEQNRARIRTRIESRN